MTPASPSSPPADPSARHFRAASRQAVSLAGALHGAGAAAGDPLASVDDRSAWNRDVRVVDLGLGGACLEASDSVARGTRVDLILDTPHLWDPLTLSGVVAWARTLPDPEGGGALLGVCFEHRTGSTVRTLTELLEAEAFG